MENLIGLKRIKENKNPSEIKIVCQTLIKIIDSIIAKPNDISCRSIKLDCHDVSENLMPYIGELW
jgi:hypothetical protein